MRLTKHAKRRRCQRGFSVFSLDIIMKHGRREKASGGATRLFFGNKEYQSAVGELKKAIQLLDKVKNGKVIIMDEHVLTMYK